MSRQYGNIDEAAVNRDWDMVLYMLETTTLKDEFSAIMYAVADKRLDVVEKIGKMYDWVGRIGADKGDLDLVKWAIERDSGNLHFIQLGAIRGGHLPIVKFLVEKGVKKHEWSSCVAAREGHLPIIEYFEEIGVKNYRDMAVSAASEGQLSIVQYCVIKGADNYSDIITSATREGHTSIVAYYMQ